MSTRETTLRTRLATVVLGCLVLCACGDGDRIAGSAVSGPYRVAVQESGIFLDVLLSVRGAVPTRIGYFSRSHGITVEWGHNYELWVNSGDTGLWRYQASRHPTEFEEIGYRKDASPPPVIARQIARTLRSTGGVGRGNE